MEHFSVELEAPLALAAARANVITNLVEALNACDYWIESQTETQIDLVATHRSYWTWFFSVITFPFGLLFFFAFARRLSIAVMLDEHGPDQTRITISGVGTPAVAKQVRDLTT